MKDLKNIKYGSSEWRLYQYQRAKEENRGHNYSYYSEKLNKYLIEKGYKWHLFTDKYSEREATSSELFAKEIIIDYKSKGYYARIIAGKSQNVQKTKMFSICYKKK